MEERMPAPLDWRLIVYGPARLLRGEETFHLRRKALALLYYLAFEGPVRRDELAELLWGHPGARSNLRSELHYLRRRTGMSFNPGSDPLEPPSGLRLDFSRHHPTPFLGLEGISPEFDTWLARKRFEIESENLPLTAGERLGAPPSDLPVPGLWILDGPVGSDAAGLAHSLAAELGLRVTAYPGGRDGLIILEPPYTEAPPVGELLSWPGAIALIRPPFGEDPALLLELRSRYPAERTRYLRVPPVPFKTARNTLLANLPFEKAAAYLNAQGRWALLSECLRAGHNLPLRFRARYRVEARFLPRKHRLALERLSVCQRPVDDDLLERLGAAEAIEELVRRRWLVYDGGWRFADPVGRRALLFDLPAGLRHHYHLRAAAALEDRGRLLEAAWQRQQAGENPDLARIMSKGAPSYAAAILDGGATAEPPKTRAGQGAPIPLLVSRRSGVGLEPYENHWLLLRPEYPGEAAWLEFEPLENDAVLVISGQLWVFAPLAGALQETPPLELRLGDGRFFLAPVESARQLDGGWLLPAAGRFEYRFFLPAGTPLALSSAAEEVAAEIDLQSFAASTGAGDHALISGVSEAAPKTPIAFAGRV